MTYYNIKWLRRIFAVLIILLFFLMIKVLLPSKSEVFTNTRKAFFNINFKGYVINKYIDKTNHSYPIVVFKSVDDSSIIKLNFVKENSGLYNLIEINDTIQKKSNTFIIKIDTIEYYINQSISKY